MNITTGVIAKAQAVVIYGTEGIGKTTLAAQFPNPVFIDTEGSTRNMSVTRMDKPSSWTMLLQQIEYVYQTRQFQTLVIDTIDWAERLCIDFVVTRGNKTSITQFDYGEGFIQLGEDFGKFLNRLTDLVESGINVVLNAHAKIVKFEQPDEMGAYDRYELKLGNKTTAKTASLVKEWADLVLFCNYKTYSVSADEKGKKFKGQGGKRVMHTTHHPAWDAKNRFGLADEIDMDFNQIAHIFNAAPIQTVAPVQPVQTVQEVQPPVQQAPVSNVPKVEQAPQPVAPTVPVAQAPQDPLPQAEPVPLNPAIPKSLQDLMIQNNVTELEIQTVVSKKGYYPLDTPIINYDPGFIDGVLVGAWVQVYPMIEEARLELPF
uniref:AAA family ATPase n=1 Tax=Jeotgalibaca porci TaxID=1868793 RepID=UPI0035A00780